MVAAIQTVPEGWGLKMRAVRLFGVTEQEGLGESEYLVGTESGWQRSLGTGDSGSVLNPPVGISASNVWLK
jgi:hypothetical protein